jgi:hypothetical protein
MSRIREQLTYANVMVTILAFIVLGGGAAYATHLVVNSSDVVDDSLRSVDIRGKPGTSSAPAVDGTLNTHDISGQAPSPGNGTPFVDGTLTQWDVRNGSLVGADVDDDSLRGADVTDDSLRGRDIDESTLSDATKGTSADNFSRAGQTLTAEKTIDASPFTTTRAGRLLVIKPIAKVVGDCSNLAGVSLWIEIDGAAVPGSVIRMNENSRENFTLAGVTASSVPAGDHTARVAMECSSAATIVAWGFDEVGAVSAVVLDG